MAGPLDGVRVVDMTTILMGPYATQTLAEMGADVIKVEPPEGDPIRDVPPGRSHGMGALFLNANRGKRSLRLDLKQPASRDRLHALLRDADVFVHNTRLDGLRRLGLDYAALAPLHPRLIHVSLVGFAQNGPYAARPAYDDLIQGGALLPSLIAQAGDGVPRYVPLALADRVVGLAAVGTICAALFERTRSGCGQAVEIPMFETMVSMVLGDHMGGRSYDPPLDGGFYRRLLARHRRPYATRDGHLCALVYTDAHWRRFLDAIGRADLLDADPRFATLASRVEHVDHVYGFLHDVFATRDTGDWLALLERADVPAMRMQTLDGIFDDPHLAATGFFGWEDHPSEGRLRRMRGAVRWSRSEPAPPRPAPRLGADDQARFEGSST